MKIVYLCPDAPTPVGGVKVIYRQAERLAAQGFEAGVLHPNSGGFCADWFEHQAPMVADGEIDPASHFIVVPEVWAHSWGAGIMRGGFRYAVFVQNGYAIRPAQGAGETTREVYRRAEFVMSISEDVSRQIALAIPGLAPEKIRRVTPSISDIFVPSEKRNSLVFLPRKLAAHSAEVAFYLEPRLPPSWSLDRLEGVSEARVAQVFGESRIFLSFSELEGFGLPPLEAALCGNLVVGYAGGGGREYFEPPLFREVQNGDLAGYVEAVLEAIKACEAGVAQSDAGEAQRRALKERYSTASELEGLEAIFAEAAVTPSSLRSRFR